MRRRREEVLIKNIEIILIKERINLIGEKEK